MARFAGIDIPDAKKVGISLRYIYGIGPTNALEVCAAAKVDPAKRMNALSDEERQRIAKALEAYKVEGELRREVSMNIKGLKDKRCYRGTRHARNLPVRGQRTHTNARTRKGKAIAIAGKKLATK